ncbi:MAG: hypothetical protein KJN79_00165 [Gammaproteobacteria bacterium]|nr:hypothetical protein [Gammaproteobacteria bacterium]
MKKKKDAAVPGFRFVNREGGKVVFSGMNGDLPRSVKSTLERYGFTSAPSGEWVDVTGPSGADLLSDIRAIGVLVPVHFEMIPPGNARGKGRYAAVIGGADGEAKDPAAALEKAHRAWNRNGRAIKGETLWHSLDKAMLSR